MSTILGLIGCLVIFGAGILVGFWIKETRDRKKRKGETKNGKDT